MQFNSTSTRTCPFCWSSIPVQAKFCRQCGKDVRFPATVRPANARKANNIPSRTQNTTILLCVLIAIFIGAACIGASAWFSHSHLASPSAPMPLGTVQPATTGNQPSQQDSPVLNAPVNSGSQASIPPRVSSGQTQDVSIQKSKPANADSNSLPTTPQTSKGTAYTGQQNEQRLVICIDPGHPSEVGRGTSGKHITEIQAVWQVALKLRSLLEQQGMKVVMTKQSEEQFVRNEQRANIANQAHAALMIRLHCDSDSGSGVATYAPTRQGRNNGKTGPERSVIMASQRMAQDFHPVMMRSLNGSLPDRGLHSDTATQVGGKQGALTGSIYSQVPVLLVEMCVLTNPYDEAFIDNDEGQQQMAQAMADGVTAALQLRVK